MFYTSTGCRVGDMCLQTGLCKTLVIEALDAGCSKKSEVEEYARVKYGTDGNPGSDRRRGRPNSMEKSK